MRLHTTWVGVSVMMLSICGLWLPEASVADSSACNLRESRKVIFSNPDLEDRVVVEIRGKTCQEATLSVEIQNLDGLVLYRSEEPLKSGFTNEVSKPDAQRVLESRLGGFAPTSELGEWGTAFDTWDPSEDYLVSRSEYERLKMQDWVSYSHQIGYEGGVTVVYDQNAERVIAVIEGSN